MIFALKRFDTASYYPAGGSSERIQTMEVVVMAAMVPMGMDFWASRRSPERLEPAMIPEQIVKKETRSEIHTHVKTTRVCVRKQQNVHLFLHM